MTVVKPPLATATNLSWQKRNECTTNQAAHTYAKFPKKDICPWLSSLLLVVLVQTHYAEYETTLHNLVVGRGVPVLDTRSGHHTE